MTSIVEERHQPFLVSQFFNPKRELYESKLYIVYGGSPGLLVMGGGSCSEGHEFESQHCILDGHDIFYIDLLKNCNNACLKRPKIKKRPGLVHF